MSDFALRPGTPIESSGQPQITELLRVVRRHIWLFSGVTVAVSLAAAGITFSLPARYTADASIYLSPETPDPLLPADASQRALADDAVTTVSSLITARDLATSVVQNLHIGETPNAAGKIPTLDQRVDAFLSHLTATPEPRSRVIDLRYVDTNPVQSAAALNAVVETFQRQQLNSGTQDLQRTASWLTHRADDLRSRWLAAEAKVGAFRAEHGLAAGAGDASGQTLVGQQIGHAANDLATAEAELAGAEARQSAMRAASDPDSAAAVSQSPGVVALAGELAQLQVRQAELHGQYGSAHPAVAAIDRQVAVARRSLEAELSRARHAIDTDVAAKRAAVATLKANLGTLNTQAGGMAGSEVSLTTLTNEATDARTAYEAFLTRAKQLDDRSALLQPQVQFASHAAVPGAPSSPNIPKFLLGGVMLGLLGGLGAALAREHLRRGFVNISRVSEALQLPLLSTVPLLSNHTGPVAQYMDKFPFSAAAESVRSLAAGLQLASRTGSAPRSLVIASATSGEGKTTIAIWLATALAAAGQKILLIDGDHRRGAVAERLGGEAGPGFADLIAGTGETTAVVHPAPNGAFDYIGAGTPTARVFGPRELSRLRVALEAFQTEYDLVIIDTPPLLAMTEALLCARAADATVFVCRWNSTARQAVASSLNRLQEAGATMLGVVLSMIDHNRLALFSDDYRGRDVRLIEGYYRHR